MSTDRRADRSHDQDEMPGTEELEEPSTEKEPGEEPKGGDAPDAEPSHDAVGIGVIDTTDSGDVSAAAPDGDPPSPAMSDEVSREAAESQEQ